VSESAALREVRLAIGSREDCRVFRNNVGQALYFTRDGNIQRVAYGLFKGSADLIGWHSVTITPDMVGKRVAVFLSVETKAARGEPAENQENWARAVQEGGGIAGFAKDAEQAAALLAKWLERMVA
jgi:hypothetical protein